MTKERIEIAPSMIEQLSEEPKKYWRTGLMLVSLIRWEGEMGVLTTERAAWAVRELHLASGSYFADRRAPFATTKEEIDTFAKAKGATIVTVRDESLNIVDSWSVK